MILAARHLAIAFFVVLLFFGVLARDIRAADKPASKSRDSGAHLDQQRKVLWESLLKTLPTKYKQIDAYGENPRMTSVLLSSQGVTMTFSLESGKLEEIQMAKRLGQINCITFERADDGGRWVMWSNGSREATIDERVTGTAPIAESSK